MPPISQPTHSVLIAYVLWFFGFTGCHRFYVGKPVSGTVYFFTLGLLGIGWFIDLLLIPSLVARAERRYTLGPYDYSLGWLLLTYFGVLGFHRFYLGKWISGIVYLCTGGVFLFGYLYDLWTFNEQVQRRNLKA